MKLLAHFFFYWLPIFVVIVVVVLARFKVPEDPGIVFEDEECVVRGDVTTISLLLSLSLFSSLHGWHYFSHHYLPSSKPSSSFFNSGIGSRQTQQVLFISSHFSQHSAWKRCLQGRLRTTSSTLNSSLHITHIGS